MMNKTLNGKYVALKHVITGSIYVPFYKVTSKEGSKIVYTPYVTNGVITREVKKRYQLISSHSARRSFATINTLRNIPRNKILRATGHSSEGSFVRYICYDEE